MPALPPTFSASEVLTAAKLNQYMEYMESLAVHQAESPGSLIFSDPVTQDVWLSKPVTAYSGSIETYENTDDITVLYNDGPEITLEDCGAVFYMLDARTHTVSGASGSYIQMRQQGGDPTTEFLRNNSTTSYRCGIAGVYVPTNPGTVTLEVVTGVAPNTTLVSAQRRLTVIKIRQA